MDLHDVLIIIQNFILKRGITSEHFNDKIARIFRTRSFFSRADIIFQCVQGTGGIKPR